MLRSRVSSSIDFARLAAAMQRPGIDPRVWVSYAIVTEAPVIDTSATGSDAGIFVDIVLLPTQMAATARVGAAYAGNGFGMYAPLRVDDEVLVVAPSGDPAEGLVVTQRLWSPSDPPPAAAATHPEDLTLVVETGKSVRLTVQGGGNVVLAVDSGKLYLGSEDGTEPVAKGQTLKAYLESLVQQLNTHVHNIVAPTPGTPTTPSSATTPPVVFIGPTDALLATTTEVL